MEQIKIQLTESAYEDLENIELYIRQDSPAIARKFISHIFDKIEQLSKYPFQENPCLKLTTVLSENYCLKNIVSFIRFNLQRR